MHIGLNLLYLKPKVVGGTETNARGLLSWLMKLDNSPRFTLFVNKETYQCNIFQGWHTVICPIRAEFRLLRYAWEQLILPFQAKKLRIDLLHSLGYVQPLRLPCKSVVTIHDLNFYNIGHLMSPLRRKVLQYFVPRSAKTADHIITVSEFSKKQIVELLRIPSKKVTVIYNAPKAPPVQKIELEELQRRYGVTQPYIFALSSRSPHKNMGNLIKAFFLLKEYDYKDLKLVLAGHLPRNSDELYTLVERSKFGKDIIFTGYVSDEVLASLYTNAEMFVFPSLYEGFGIPVLEAFQYGTPVACSNRAALPEIAGDAAVYFDPTDVEGMAEMLGLLLADENKRRCLVQIGKQRVAHFTWGEAARKTLAVYRQVLSS